MKRKETGLSGNAGKGVWRRVSAECQTAQRDTVLRDEEECSERGLVEVRRLALAELDEEDADRPHVHTVVVRLAADDFGRHPVRRADDRLALLRVLVELCGIAKVRELHIAVHGEQDVVRLDVAVDARVLVDVAECAQHTPEDVADLPLGEKQLPVQLEQIRQRSAVHVFHAHPKLVLDEIAVVVGDDVGVLALLHDAHFDGDQLGALFGQRHLFQRDLFARWDKHRKIDLPGSAFADLLRVAEQRLCGGDGHGTETTRE